MTSTTVQVGEPRAASRARLALAEGEVHVWTTATDEVGEGLLAEYDRLLAPDERARAARFAFPHLRHEYLVTRALARCVPSLYDDVAPEAWQFVRNRHGKPELAGPQGARLPRINLSNTGGLVACAVTARVDLGVDVEDRGRRGDLLAIAEHHFAAAELDPLRALAASAEAQRDRFFQIWTLKEAYIKARGLGLAIPLDQFWFRLADGQEPQVGFAPQLGDDPACWRFSLARPTSRHWLALAVRSGAGGPPLSIRVGGFVPLRDLTPKPTPTSAPACGS